MNQNPDPQVLLAQKLSNEVGRTGTVVRVEETDHPLTMQLVYEDGTTTKVHGLFAHTIKHAAKRAG